MLLLQGFVIVLLAVLRANGDATDNGPCCYPNQMSGDAYIGSGKLHTFSIDYERNMIYEDWEGRLFTRSVLYDLNNGKKYRILRTGQCREYALTNLGNYAQCPPDDAGVEENHNSITYTYDLDGVSVVKKVAANTCYPEEIIKNSSSRIMRTSYHNVTSTINDPSVFVIPQCD